MRLVACPVPTTAGMPYSRATIAAWDIVPPMSETAALILPNTGAQLGAVIGQTRISPVCTWSSSFGDVMTRAGPSAIPADAATPCSSRTPSAPPSVERCQRSMVSPVIRTQEGYRILKVISKEPAGQRELNDPRVQQNIRETLLNRKDQLLKAAFYEVERNGAKVENFLARSIIERTGKPAAAK